MFAFPRTLPRRSNFLLGCAGVLATLALWWALTSIPVRSETRHVAREVEYEELAYFDPVAGESAVTRVPGRQLYDTLTVSHPLIDRRALESPQNTFAEAWRLLTERTRTRPITLGQHILASSWRVVAGFLIASLVAVPLGVVMALFPRIRALINPIVSFLRPLPSISWVPLMVIWFGVDELQKLAIIFMGSFSAALIYSLEATMKVDPALLLAAQNLGASKRQLITRVLLPAALPNILSGLKVVLAIAWTCVISAEIVGTNEGLGSLIWNSKEVFNTSAVLAGMVCISGVVLVLDALMSRLERWLLPWRHRGPHD